MINNNKKNCIPIALYLIALQYFPKYQPNVI